MSTTETMSLLKSLTPSELLSLLAETQKAATEEARKRAEIAAIETQKFCAVYTAELERITDEMAAKGQEFNQSFSIVFDKETGKYAMTAQAANAPKAKRDRRISTSINANVANNSQAVVDGTTYRSYREAYDELGYTWEGTHPSFNARYELARLGHQVGPAVR